NVPVSLTARDRFPPHLRPQLPPLLGKPFGSSPGLVDPVINRDPHGHTLHPLRDEYQPRPNATSAANWTRVLTSDGKGHAVAEVENLLKLELKLIVRTHPVLVEATDRRYTLEARTERRRVPD